MRDFLASQIPSSCAHFFCVIIHGCILNANHLIDSESLISEQKFGFCWKYLTVERKQRAE